MHKSRAETYRPELRSQLRQRANAPSPLTVHAAIMT
jgi:hypothetical protein